jgi:hypothetical protein
VWALPNADTKQQANCIKAIFYTHPSAHDPVNPSYGQAIAEVLEYTEINNNKFCAVHYSRHHTYEDALTELDTLERRSLGRVIFGR